MREAEAAANLQHPNIVAIHEVGEHGGQHYFSMDYVAGRDLGALVKDGPLPPRRAAHYVKIIAEAIHFAHQRGTLHRDLKPQNVLIDAADQPRITDFGLAKIMNDDSRLTQSGVVMGSPSYMPPEQAAGRLADVGPASDVYSLGAMLYELLTGRPPFRGATAMATLCDVMEAEPAAPRRLRTDIPPDLETICLKCLEKTPSARYPTARALAEELDRFLKGEPIQARPASPIRKAVSWTRRHPAALAALAALVMVALAFGVFYLYEENAFLRAQQAGPALARVPGSLHESLQVWSAISSFAAIAGIWLFLIVERRARGLLNFKQWLNPALHARPRAASRSTNAKPGRRRRPAPGRLRHPAPGDDDPGLRMGGRIDCPPNFPDLWRHLLRARDIGIGHPRLPSGVLWRSEASTRQLPPEQIEAISRALENHDWPAALQCYREAAPDADLAEAKQSVMRLFVSLRMQHPEKFVPPPLSLATLNWNAMLLCALVEAGLLGVLWYMTPPSHPALAVAQFACSFLFGMGVIAGLRVKGWWKRMLLLTPAVAAIILSEAVVPRLAETSHSVGAYLCGFFFGILLMLFGFNPFLGRRFAKP